MSKANDAPQNAITKEEFNEGLSVAKADIVAVVSELRMSMNEKLDGMDKRFDGMEKTLKLIAKSQTWILEVLVTQDNQLTESRLVELSKH